MKKKITLLVLLNLIAFLGYSQCSAEHYASSDASLMENFTVIKQYRIDGRDGQRKKIEYTAVLSKDTFYRLTINSKDGEANGIVVTVYNAEGQAIITNNANNKQHNRITFKSSATGIYRISYTFKNSKSYCGFGKLGFSRNYQMN